jgi:VWFA-related protein
MKNVGAYLASIGPERKLVMLISSNPAVAIRDDPARPGPLKEMLQALQRANVAVYAFDPQGLTRRDTDEARQSRDDLLSISEATGGRGITGTNAPESLVRDVFRQNSSYYLLGFRPSHTTRDGRFHRISVRVKQPDVTVRTRSGYYASK